MTTKINAPIIKGVTEKHDEIVQFQKLNSIKITETYTEITPSGTETYTEITPSGTETWTEIQ